MNPKVQHVLNAGQSRYHQCHWPACRKQVPPAMWGCRPHWFKLPPDIRSAIWQSYRPGQENDPTLVNDAYILAARRARDWIVSQGYSG